MIRPVVALTCGVFVLGPPVLAQDTAGISGRVVHAVTNAGIAGAEVRLGARGSPAVTDSSGAFRFDAVPAGRAVMHVRRLGFKPESLAVELPHAATITIELQEAPQALDTVNVTGRNAPIPRGKLAGFYERKQFGIGRFLESAEIEKYLSRRLGDILLSRVPGIRIMRSRRSGSAAYVYSTRLGTGCYPDVYLDGAVVYSSGTPSLPGMSIENVLFDINSIDPGHVSAVEFYSGPAQMPAQYNRTGSACGALLVWTK